MATTVPGAAPDATNAGTIDATVPHDAGITAAIHRFVGSSQAALVLVQADDLAGEKIAVNLPGVDRERPNWRRKLAVDVDALWRTEAAARTVTDLAADRRGR